MEPANAHHEHLLVPCLTGTWLWGISPPHPCRYDQSFCCLENESLSGRSCLGKNKLSGQPWSINMSIYGFFWLLVHFFYWCILYFEIWFKHFDPSLWLEVKIWTFKGDIFKLWYYFKRLYFCMLLYIRAFLYP